MHILHITYIIFKRFFIITSHIIVVRVFSTHRRLFVVGTYKNSRAIIVNDNNLYEY